MKKAANLRCGQGVLGASYELCEFFSLDSQLFPASATSQQRSMASGASDDGRKEKSEMKKAGMHATTGEFAIKACPFQVGNMAAKSLETVVRMVIFRTRFS
jgi:hypothetical protein